MGMLATALIMTFVRLLKPSMPKYRQNPDSQLATLLDVPAGLLQERPIECWVLSHSTQHHSKMVLSGDQDVHVDPSVTHQVQAAPELIELWGTIKHIPGKRAANFRRVVQEPDNHLAVAPELLDRLEQGAVHYTDELFLPRAFPVVFSSGIFNLLLSLSPRNHDRDADCDETADRLNPCSPLLHGETWNGCLLATESPSNQRSSAERHQSYYGPVPVCSSVLHVVSPSMDRILPLGVAA